ncbi:hypothetical protein [Sporosarcina sp. FA9]|uniref:hypothetical protein n=1 Tax=Sporosarcina sp. FA9 TaxID=3413030 RepID=UPI003F6609EC
MKSLTISISTRIFTLLMLGFYILSINDFQTLSGIRPFFIGGFFIALLLDSRQQHIYKKNHLTGRLTYQERVLPEFNSNDERESELTGKAAKNAFSIIILLMPIILVLLGFMMIFNSPHLFMYTYLSFIAIPIIGLLTYFFSYRFHYLN